MRVSRTTPWLGAFVHDVPLSLPAPDGRDALAHVSPGGRRPPTPTSAGRPPNAWPRSWWPRQIPKMGVPFDSAASLMSVRIVSVEANTAVADILVNTLQGQVQPGDDVLN